MKLLLVDTATPYETVALTVDGVPLVERCRRCNKGHGPGLLNDIEGVLQTAGITLNDLDAFVSGLGPGSFTGTRVAMATLKGLAMATGKPLYGVSTLDALRAPFLSNDPLAIMDAKRGEVYAKGCGIEEPICIAPELLSGKVFRDPGVIVGDGAWVYREIFKKAWPNAVIPTGAANHWPRAALMEPFVKGEAPALATLEPCYVRRSDAEINYPMGLPDAFGHF